ncbi:MAG: phage tail assembly protein [Psychrobacter alimentarius]
MSDIKFETVELSKPIKRGEKSTINSFTVRKPQGGDLRGLSLMLVAQADYDTAVKLIPRITDPVIHKHELDGMGSDDIMDAALKISGFFLKSEKPSPVTAP